MFTDILNYKVFNKDKKQLIKYIKKFDKVNIISGNPEVLYMGIKDKFLNNIYTSSNSVIIPDGVGTVLASKFLKNPVEEKIAGIEVMDEIIKKCEKENKGIYLVGAKQEVLDNCILNLKNKYPNLKIEGSHNGYFDLENCSDIVDDIKDKNPYALFVAMGCPRQEIFIQNNFEKLPCNIFMGVGGSFDVFSGKVNRAPKWMINFGLEWLYRVIKEPFRIKRLAVIPKFLAYVILHKNKKSTN
ncbi:WecB/TagA/CpsF family glycosyltransferase [Clostridium botulinum]|uniref:N-acetylglucosaminyldiphosphoundecaprenol N-acetyl-beta-D-mannosaminyltransferase n=1 Tax=Clostridium botulinum C/D str. DC5 TaxID=1443128 RepID=A0A0A0IFG0_CLOBO|nr:WecB/TagA/CpsF family glycosyltransferase [Clostridium botulinum]KEI06385.1 UDP-N-acetyl-D-mannosaminuronic acid transferase [Clostridium botulinum C/D str. BKT75002]KEI09204.1 UDP-N-acetyl-D-mannosaminuronic acid transferase [Clostridium botulinum C/D str. BKT2873]KGM97320.1 UDP-N-acetyl-D-mannosaminuronic acid transferase [Clostridium botulinum D str. CCUG 7971]KGM99253.1 UDP-N-acetyl-D-mannosaminuronic acid transferase [Clostridium botulinum C/D str. DC5]KOC46975.1 UDP-N-acetyl-D-mannosa